METIDDNQKQAKRPEKSKWGLSDKTFWDWLNLTGVLLVPLMIAVLTLVITVQQNRISQLQHDIDQNIALDQQRQTTLTTYMVDIKDLLLKQGLRGSKQGDAVSVVARAETVSALRQLDGTRKGLLIQFLSEAGLITGTNAVISLSGAELSHIDLRGADLGGTNLLYADLSDGDLRGTKLNGPI